MRYVPAPGPLAGVVVGFALIGMALPRASGQAPPSEIDAEIARQRQIIERFVTVLERNPRRGTALDRIYGFHIENGTIEAFVKELQDRLAAKPQDGAGWMILGLVESQRGRDAAAVAALTKAKELRAIDPLAAYYLGQSLLLVGQPDQAAAAFEEAISRKPPQADLLEIFQALGRVHQRAQRTQEALAVWSRLEKLFPNDPRVAEQIALTLVEEAQLAAALPRYEALAKITTDDYRRTAYRIEAAELKVKLNRSSEGIADLESLLAKLNPESWLFREVRRKIEDVFLRTDNQEGLARYYTAWLAKNADDIDAMARLARVLARQARVGEAQQWLDKALRLAPSRRDLRLAFIEQLIDDQRYPEAIQQYAELDKAEPNNPDCLRDWGKLILRDTSRPKAERQAEAEQVWRRMVAARPSDPLVATQVADLLRHADMPEPALALYQRAVELAPAQPQYREYLGEYLHILKRPDEALATWRQIAAGKLRTAANLARLAEVFAQFGYVAEALPEIAAACELDPKDFSLQLKAADLQIRGELWDAALASLTRGEALAQNDEEREVLLTQRIKVFTLESKLADLAAQLTQETAKPGAPAQQWFLLARYREALREWPEATRAIQEALRLEPNNIPSLASAARIAEQAGDLKTSADLNRKLALVDRRSRSEYLQHVAQLETQLGRIDEALAAGRDLIAAAPGNVETYQFFADLCFRLGRPDDGLAALRRAARVNPNEPNILLALAAALAGQFRTDEAIELYWQAFEKGGSLDDRLMVVGKLTELYMQTNHFDKLLERLERFRREDDQRREMTICLAQAYQSAGDYGMARQELERLLSENTRDTQLLLQLSKLAESESDLTAAIKFQEQLTRLAPGAETEYRLATLCSRAGDVQQAAAILVRLAIKEEDQEKLLRNLDSLLNSGQEETALAVLEPKLRENPADWELLYRAGVALVGKQPQEAARRFQAILDLPLPDDELAITVKNRLQSQKGKAATTFASAPTVDPRTSRLNYVSTIRRAIGLDRELYGYSSSGRSVVWTPTAFGYARQAAIGWLYKLAMDGKAAEAFVAARGERAAAATATPRELWDWVYLQSFRNETGELLPIARRLAEQGGLPEQYLYLTQLASRGDPAAVRRAGGPEPKDKTPPLSPEELALAQRCFATLQKLGGTPQSMPSYSLQAATNTILTELRRAGRPEDEQRLFRETIERAKTPDELSSAMQLAQQRRDRTAFLTLFDRLAAEDLREAGQKPAASVQRRTAAAQQLAMWLGQSDPSPDEVLQTLDRYLAYHAAKINQLRSSPTYRLASRSAGLRSGSNYVYIWSGNSQRGVTLTFPAPGEYFDQQALSLLRTAFENFRTKDLVSDLVKHLETRAGQTAAAGRLFDLLALGYIQAWNDDRESAVASLGEAAALAPHDLDLRLEIAQLHVEMKQLEEALTLVDAILPLDQRTLQQRETLALDLAVRLGDLQRAREAAQRLFGLRLDAETQVGLAGQMRRLGMAEEAEAVLARAQRQAGSRLSALAALMGRHLADGKTDVAAQIAFQILRRSRTASAAQLAQGYITADSQYRTSALACLAQAGKLKELIAGIEEQLERSPQATQLFETLGEYYTAAGEPQKSLDLTAKLIALRPDDGDLRYRYAQELYRRGKFAEACDQYKVVVKKQPQLLSRRYYEVVQAFQRAKQEVELAKALDEIDLKSLGQPYLATQLISYLMRTPAGQAAGMQLFKKAWNEVPSERSNLMSQMYSRDAWKLPEVLEYGKQSLLPTADLVRRDPWHGLSSSMMSYDQNGRITTLVQRVFEGAHQSSQLGKLRADIAAASAAHPAWLAGPILVALIDLRQGRTEGVAAAVKPLLEADGADYRLHYARWIVAQELESRPELQAAAIALYEAAAQPMENSMVQFEYSPAHRLTLLYKERGDKDKARELMLRVAKDESGRANYSPQSYLGQKAQNLIALGQKFQEMDMPADALRMYRELLGNPDFADPMLGLNYGNGPDYFRNLGQQGIEAVTKKFAEHPTAEVAQALLAPPEKTAPGTPIVDLMITARVGPPNRVATLDSPLARLIRPAGLNAEAVAAIEAQLADLAQRHPQDLSVRIAAALFALAGNDAAKSKVALDDLIALVESTPLEELPPARRANARQRAAAAQQVGLWLVARGCLPDAAERARGEQLAERAVGAAGRQLGPEQLTAILYEQGKIALDAGERALAERRWNELIDLALVEPRKPRAGNAAAAGTAQTPPRSGVIPATLSQFTLASSVSLAAAENGLPELSLRAIREALSGGLPVTDLPATGADPFAAPRVRTTAASVAVSRADIDQAVYMEMSQRLWQLSTVWKQKQLPPAEVCRFFEEIVFPAARPNDVLLYEQTLSQDLSNPRSVGRLLVDWAVLADRVEELQRQVAARQATATDVVSGRVLLVQLHVARSQPQQAREQLAALNAELESSKLASLVALAAHAAAAAVADDELLPAAVPLLEKLTVATSGRPVSSLSPTVNSPVTILTRHYIQRGDMPAARAQIERYLQSRQQLYARYSGDSGQYYQRRDLAWAADELARGGDLATTLAALGRFADVPLSRERDTGAGAALWRLSELTKKLPADQRYEQLRDWSLPTADRRSVRLLAAFDAGQRVPDLFLKPGERPYDPAPRVQTISNLALLVEAAREAGKLTELRQLAEPLVAEKVPAGDTLAMLVLLAQKDEAARPLLAKLTDDIRQRMQQPPAPETRVVPDLYSPGQQPVPIEWTDFLPVQAALAEPEFAAAGALPARLLRDHAHRSYGNAFTRALEDELLAHELRTVAVAERPPVTASPALWYSGGEPKYGSAGGDWVAHEGHLVHLTGQSWDQLYFRYPLEGEFEFSFESLNDTRGQVGLAYAGLVCTTDSILGLSNITPVMESEALQRAGLPVNREGWNRISVRASPTGVRHYFNGHLSYEDKDPSRISPWLHFQARAYGQSALKNLRLSGTPTIPREVRLLDRNRLEGWIAIGERLPQRIAPVNANNQPGGYYYDAAGNLVSAAQQSGIAFDWSAKDGVLSGAADPLSAATTQSRFYYHRPLLSGERVRYQFRHQPGSAEVHPALGNTAFLLMPEGLKLHWIAARNTVDSVAIDPFNAADDPGSRRGPARLPLKEDDWNDVELAIDGEAVSIRLNGELVCQRPVESTSDRRFGLFRYKSHAAEVRNLVLTGDWPQSLAAGELANLAAHGASPASVAVQRARHALVGESLLAGDAFAVWQQARRLAPEERFEFLKAWVFPGPAHPTLRLYVDWTPTDPPPTSSTIEPPSHSHAGGELISPALELIAVAKELNRLDELTSAAALAAKELPDQARNVASFELLLAIGRAAAAAASRQKLALDFIQKQPADTPVHERHAEFLAAHAALAQPATRPLGLELAAAMVSDQDGERRVNEPWERRVRRLLAVARWQTDPATASVPFGQTPPLAQWHIVSRPTAESRGVGYPPPAWRLSKGQVAFATGSAREALYFAVPLRGNFELRWELAGGQDRRALRPLYAGLAFDLDHEKQTLQRHAIGSPPAAAVPLAEPIKDLGPKIDYRLSVQDGVLAIHVNGQKLLSEPLPADADPWLAIDTHKPQYSGVVQNVRVLGQPTIPREIALSAGPSLQGWTAEYYAEAASADGQVPTWSKSGNEIAAPKLANAEGSFRESLLQYHRPLLEDGELQYEFFYEPGKTEVHPALDRAVFLMRPEGVQLHWLTDAQYDRTGMAPDNAEPLPGANRVPLRAGEWNLLLLALKGNEATITVNGTQVARRQMEPGNRRSFGLFRYSDLSGVRVRNVVHRGQWPVSLPRIDAEQR